MLSILYFVSVGQAVIDESSYADMLTLLRRNDTENGSGGVRSGGRTDPFPLSIDQQSFERKSLNR